jgi:putative tricarboxylic transport membrane protein
MLNKTHDQKSGLFWFVIGAVIAYFSVGYGLGSLSEPGPGYTSFAMGIIIMGLSGTMVMRDARRGERQTLSSLFRGNWLRVLCTAGGILIYGILLPYLGFVVTSVILIYCLIFLAGDRRHVVAGVMAVAVSLISYYIFVSWLQVSLPAGMLQEWLMGRLS